MLSTLSKWRILARMMYPEYIGFEKWVAAATDTYKGNWFDKNLCGVRCSLHYRSSTYHMLVGDRQLLSAQCTWSRHEDRAIFIFQRIERNIKGNESIFAPRRREPGV